MKKLFETPNFEVVHFMTDDIVTTSSDCCDVGGIDMGTDDEACPSGDAECQCSDQQANCA